VGHGVRLLPRMGEQPGLDPPGPGGRRRGGVVEGRQDRGRAVQPMALSELDPAKPAESILQSAERLGGPPLVGEHVAVRIGGHHYGYGRPAQCTEDRLGRRRGVLVVVDQDVVDRVVRSQVTLQERDGLEQEAGEVGAVTGGERLEVPAIEPGHLGVLVPPGPFCQARHRVLVEEPLLGPEDEVGDLPSEPGRLEEVREPGPVGRRFLAQHLPDGRVLLGRGQELWGRGVPELLEPAAEEAEGEPVGRVDGKGGQRPPQTVDQPLPGVAGSSAMKGQEDHPFGIGSPLEQPGEPLSEQGGLARSGRAGDQQGPSGEVQNRGLLRGRGEGEPRDHRLVC
jgi:hypothetical protein